MKTLLRDRIGSEHLNRMLNELEDLNLIKKVDDKYIPNVVNNKELIYNNNVNNTVNKFGYKNLSIEEFESDRIEMDYNKLLNKYLGSIITIKTFSDEKTIMITGINLYHQMTFITLKKTCINFLEKHTIKLYVGKDKINSNPLDFEILSVKIIDENTKFKKFLNKIFEVNSNLSSLYYRLSLEYNNDFMSLKLSSSYVPYDYLVNEINYNILKYSSTNTSSIYTYKKDTNKFISSTGKEKTFRQMNIMQGIVFIPIFYINQINIRLGDLFRYVSYGDDLGRLAQHFYSMNNSDKFKYKKFNEYILNEYIFMNNSEIFFNNLFFDTYENSNNMYIYEKVKSYKSEIIFKDKYNIIELKYLEKIFYNNLNQNTINNNINNLFFTCKLLQFHNFNYDNNEISVNNKIISEQTINNLLSNSSHYRTYIN